MTTNVCMFCGPTDSPITAEHFWPKWISRAWRVPKYVGTLHVEGRVERPVDIRWSSKSVINTVLRAVCKRCNNERLNVLEGRVKDIITPLTHGQELQMSRQNQRDIAAWVTRLVMLYEFAHSHTHGHYFQPDDRRLFIDTLAPLRDTWVWLGVFRGKIGTGALLTNIHIPKDSRGTEGIMVGTGIMGRM